VQETGENRPTFGRPERGKESGDPPNSFDFLVAGEGFEPSTFGL
jgi:hypothetical protein